VRHLPAGLLAIVGVCQVALALSANLTPWKGGGFGMFSTLDHGGFRGVTIVVDAPDRSETLHLVPSIEEAAGRAIAFPSRFLLQRLAEEVVARERRYGRPVTRVRLTVWDTQFDRQTLRATERNLRAFEYAVP
jgi:hypothetical protein